MKAMVLALLEAGARIILSISAPYKVVALKRFPKEQMFYLKQVEDKKGRKQRTLNSLNN